MTSNSLKPSAKQHRRELRDRRNALTPAQQKHASLKIQKQLFQFQTFHRARHIGAYWPNDGEPNLLNIFDDRFYLPILREGVRPWQPKGLLFGRATESLGLNPFGIPEPQTSTLVTARQLDLMLVPLVGFDSTGNRLGMGGGYYDRTFAEIGGWKKVFKLGVAHSFQKVEALDPEDWDQRLDGVVTDDELVLFN